MLRVTIEYLPCGDMMRREVLGRVDIINDGTGTEQSGNYNVWSTSAPRFSVTRQKRITNWPRLERNFLDIVREAMKDDSPPDGGKE